MAFLDTFRRLQLDNISDENRNDFRVMAELYNFFGEQVTNTVNGNLGQDNLTRELITIEVTVDSNGTPILGGTFGASGGIVGSKVLRAVNLTNQTIFPSSAPFITFTALNTGQNLYRIQNITGLPANNQFRLFVELVPDN